MSRALAGEGAIIGGRFPPGILSLNSSETHNAFLDRLHERVPRASLTLGMVLLCAGVFCIEMALARAFWNIPSSILIPLGGNFAPLVQHGQPWRLLTALFLHGGLLHLGFNMWALYQAGQVVERLFGRLGFGLIYLGAGLLGSLASLWWHPGVVGVGASGAIFGVYGAALAYLLVLRSHLLASVFQEMRTAVVGFIGYSLVMGFAVPGIDNAAHLGGLLGGCVLGAGLATPLTSARPVRWGRPRNWLALVLSLGLGLGLWGQTPELPEPRLQARQQDAFERVLLRFSQVEPALLQEQQQVVMALREHRLSDGAALERLEQDLLPEWERQVTQLSWAQPSPERAWEQQELIRYASARRDAVKALAQAVQTHDTAWIDQANALQAQAEQILLQIRLQASAARARKS